MRIIAAFTAVILILVALPVLAEDSNTNISTDPFEGLVDIILNEEEREGSIDPEQGRIMQELEFDYPELEGVLDFVEKNGEEEEEDVEFSILLSDLIRIYNSKPKKTDTDPLDVLSYLADIYSEHGYNDTGNWAKNTGWKHYVPYEGKLPEYEMSDFQLPARGRLTSSYGYRPKYGRFHKGIDVAMNLGDTVCCALPGVVTVIGYEKGGYGRYVVVSHSGGVETLYGHLTMSIVNPGQSVYAGDAIGLAGSTGNSTGPHLHFETRYRGVAIDPVSWFNLSDSFR